MAKPRTDAATLLLRGSVRGEIALSEPLRLRDDDEVVLVVRARKVGDARETRRGVRYSTTVARVQTTTVRNGRAR